MSEPEHSSAEAQSWGFFHPFKTVLGAIASAFHTRLELFVTELEEERGRLKVNLLLALLAFFSVSHGFILLTIFVVALLWQAGWMLAIGGLAAPQMSRHSPLSFVSHFFPATLKRLFQTFSGLPLPKLGFVVPRWLVRSRSRLVP